MRLKNLLTVTAPANEAVKSIARLSSSKKARDEARVFVAEGRKLVEEALRGGFELLELFVLKDALGAYEGLFPSVSGTVYAVTQPIMNKITESKTPQDITAVFAYKSCDTAFDGRRYLCLERVQEPGNVGALIRSAAAFGFDGVVLSADCADVYSVKALRGAMGATFRLPVKVVGDLRGFVREMRSAGFKAYAAALRDDAVSLEKAEFAEKLLLLIGNEGNGLDAETVALCDGIVRIPMADGTESLNAAVAGSVLMWEVSEWRRNSQSGSHSA
ncbi:MAG: RNA methyltransferase [Clostridia bacterium]|nr:RNA methyltransferase [Clostridia bacterium]